MTLNDLANLGQVIGALAVVISLIYVAFKFDNTQTQFDLLSPRPCTSTSRNGII